ncbi:MAG: hypothetical protein PUK54_10190 [Firmicutes bacterium]|nr:hypothetical protein [Bacillota bacterium]MDY5856932.1 DUF6709 family protein [Anaerovoracaceae bacterium]
MEFRKIGSIAGMEGKNAAEIAAEYKEAKKFGKVRVGKEHVFFSGLFTTEYAEADDIKWIYKRQEDSQTSVCCGQATFETYFLMAQLADGTVKKHRVETAEELKGAMETIASLNASVDVGFTPELKEKYGSRQSNDGK